MESIVDGVDQAIDLSPSESNRSKLGSSESSLSSWALIYTANCLVPYKSSFARGQ
jgi:hypothetical protein